MKKFLVCVFFEFGLLFFLLLSTVFSQDIELQKAKNYRGDENVKNWYMSEKLDGIRGYWNGKGFQTRKGNPIFAPKWFTNNFPPFELDGELWSSRKSFEFIQSTVLDKRPTRHWQKITYNIFEVPYAEGDLLSRLQKAREWFEIHENSNVTIISQIICKDKNHLQQFLKEVEAKGGEGVIVKNPHAEYHTGRSSHILKVKNHNDMEGTVIKVNPGKGRLKNMMGSLTVRLEGGLVFKLGSGFSDVERKNPPMAGTVVTFKYYGFTKKGKPKFASYLRIRND